MSLPEFKELDLEEIAPLLTWHEFDYREFGRLQQESDYKIKLPLGTILRDANGNMWLVGNAADNAYSEGCGCCSDPIEAVEIAFLAETMKFW